MKKLRDILGKQVLFLDGGTGSVLQSRGLKSGELPERWNYEKSDEIVSLHYNYFAAGSNIVCTNTFGAYSSKFEKDELEKIIFSALRNADEARKLIENGELKIENGESEEIQRQVRDDEALRQAQRPSLRLHQSQDQRPSLRLYQPQAQRPTERFIALDIGPCGKLLKPMGDLDFEDAVSLFKNTISIALRAEILPDLIVIETMNDAYETKAAVIAAKEAREEATERTGNKELANLPIFATNVYDKSSRLLTGATPEVMAAILEGLGVDALGLNCGLGPEDLTDAVERLLKSSHIPVIVKPNAGLPQSVGGKTVYNVGPNEFASSMKKFAEMGAAVLGGCCGTTPAHIEKLASAVTEPVEVPAEIKGRFESLSVPVVSSYNKVVEIGCGLKPKIIGERINPTGKKKFKEALRQNDISYIIQQGLEQIDAKSDILDVNVGLPEIDEKKMMVDVMTELQSVSDIPLQIDTSSPDVMEAALRRYNGKALVNSVNGKEEVMDAIFPLVKKYGGVVVALTLDESGIPETSEGRIKIIEKILERAARNGIGKENILVDALTMSVSSDVNAAKATLETVKYCAENSIATVLGVSNISFGLPNREFVTSQFFSLAMENGLTAAIINPLSFEIQKAYKTFCLLHGFDENCAEYIDFATFVAREGDIQKTCENSRSEFSVSENCRSNFHDDRPENSLQNAVVRGLKTEAASFAKELLATCEPVSIINDHLIPALDTVGKGFEAKTLFLPQLLMAAEAAKAAFEEIKSHLAASGTKGESKGKVILATVKGDIHDIGKNIVKVLLENYDFEVLDLGKDVAPEAIVDCAVKNGIRLVGLSALMTTTVPAMKETIELLREKSPETKVVVGGAVLTQEYADMIGADKYAKDAIDSVRFAKQVFQNEQ